MRPLWNLSWENTLKFLERTLWKITPTLYSHAKLADGDITCELPPLPALILSYPPTAGRQRQISPYVGISFERDGWKPSLTSVLWSVVTGETALLSLLSRGMLAMFRLEPCLGYDVYRLQMIIMLMLHWCGISWGDLRLLYLHCPSPLHFIALFSLFLVFPLHECPLQSFWAILDSILQRVTSQLTCCGLHFVGVTSSFRLSSFMIFATYNHSEVLNH